MFSVVMYLASWKRDGTAKREKPMEKPKEFQSVEETNSPTRS